MEQLGYKNFLDTLEERRKGARAPNGSVIQCSATEVGQ